MNLSEYMYFPTEEEIKREVENITNRGVQEFAALQSDGAKDIALSLDRYLAISNGVPDLGWGRSDLRMDILVTTADLGEENKPYKVETLPFPRVKDGDELIRAQDDVLAFYGKAKNFLSFQIVVSVDDEESKKFSDIINSDVLQKIPNQISVITALATMTNPTTAAISAAVGASYTIAKLAWDALGTFYPKNIFVHRKHWLQKTQNLGIGEYDIPFPNRGNLEYSIREG